MTRWELWLAGWGASALLLSALYLVQRRTRDATAVDAGWGTALYATLAPGELSQRLLIAVPLGLENLRIASLVWNRLGRGEDSRYSRHPNYFFQTLTWVGCALIALAAPWGWAGLLAPVLILYLVLFVTGVPPAEESSLRSRGEAYRRYRRETSVFVPWFPGRSSTA